MRTLLWKNPIALEELLLRVKKVKANKSPRLDGTCQAFLKTILELSKQDMLAVLNHMYIDGIITDNQKHGLLLCLLKKPGATSLEDYRPLTLLRQTTNCWPEE